MTTPIVVPFRDAIVRVSTRGSLSGGTIDMATLSWCPPFPLHSHRQKSSDHMRPIRLMFTVRALDRTLIHISLCVEPRSSISGPVRFDQEINDRSVARPHSSSAITDECHRPSISAVRSTVTWSKLPQHDAIGFN